MPSQGPLSAGAGANIAGPNTDWATPGNVTVSDDSRATAALAISGASDGLQMTAFGFSIPAGATINGFVVEIEKSMTGAGTINDASVFLVKGGVVVGTDHGVVPAWPATYAFTTYGSSSDLWGTTWTVAQVNASNFGVEIAALEAGVNTATARVDFGRITVYYTLPTRSFSPGFIGV